MKNLPLLLISMMLAGACSSSTSSDENELDALISELRNATASFHDIDNAITAGWTEDISGSPNA